MGFPSQNPGAEDFPDIGPKPAVGHDASLRCWYVSDRIVDALWRNVAIVVWGTQATQGIVDALEERTRMNLEECPQGISVVHIVLDGTPLPDSDARVGLAEISKRYGPNYGCVLTVIEGDGFWRSAMRSFVTGIHWVGRMPYHAKICSTVEEAAKALPEPHRKGTGVSVNPAMLVSVLREARGRIAH